VFVEIELVLYSILRAALILIQYYRATHRR
jgi:hypothetical protein